MRWCPPLVSHSAVDVTKLREDLLLKLERERFDEVSGLRSKQKQVRAETDIDYKLRAVVRRSFGVVNGFFFMMPETSRLWPAFQVFTEEFASV